MLSCIAVRLEQAEARAERNSDLVHTLSNEERWAGIYEKAPSDSQALGGYFGLAINCLSAALYMVSRYSVYICVDVDWHCDYGTSIYEKVSQVFQLIGLVSATSKQCLLSPSFIACMHTAACQVLQCGPR